MASPFNIFDFSALGGASSIAKPPLQTPGVTGGGVMPPTISGQPALERPQVLPTQPVQSTQLQIGKLDNEKIKRFIDHGKSIGKSKEDIMTAYQKGIKSGAFNKMEAPKQETGFFNKIGQFAEERGTKALDLQSKDFSDVTKGAGALGEGLGFIGDVVFEGLSRMTPDVVKETIKSGAKGAWESTPESVQNLAVASLKAGGETWKSFEQEYPETARNVTSALQIGSVVPIGKGAQVGGKVIVKGAEKTGEIVGKTGEVIGDIGGKVKKTKQGLSDKAVQLQSGLTKEQVAGLQSNPYQAKEFEGMVQRLESPEGIGDIKDFKVERVGKVTKELTDEIDKIRSDKGETSEVYKTIRESTTPVKTEQLFNDFESTLKKNGMDIVDGDIVRVPGSKAKDLNDADISKFNRLYKDLQADAQKGFLTSDEILTFRKTASDLAKYDATTSTTGQGIMKGLRKDIDNTAKSQIPGLKELDAQFVDKLDEFENAIKDLVYKQGDVKGEWRSNIVNIIGTLDRANRAKLLERLDDVMPGIGEKIQAIDNLPSIYKSLQDKGIFEKYIGTGGALAGYTAFGPLGAVAGYIGGKLLDTGLTATKTKALKSVLGKVSEEGKKRLQNIDMKIKNKQEFTQQDKDLLDSLKLKLQNELKSTDGTMNKSPSTPVTSGMVDNSGSIGNKIPKISIKDEIAKSKPIQSIPEAKPLITPPKPTQAPTIPKTIETPPTAKKTGIISPVKSKSTEIPEGYFKNAFGEIVKNPNSKKAGTLNIGQIGKDLGLIKKGDDLKPLIEEAKKYKSVEEFVKAQNDIKIKKQRGWSAPGIGNNNLNDVLKGKHNQPKDYFDIKSYDNIWNKETKQAIKEAKKTGEITIYRAVNKDINTWRDGDWVYFNENKAVDHGKNALNGDYHVISKTVKNKDVYWDGNDINEWGYDSGNETKKLKEIWKQAEKEGLQIPIKKNIDNDLLELKKEARRLENESEWDKLGEIRKKIYNLENKPKGLIKKK